MKKLTCELCGSNDFVKEDGLFVCQSCGTKYSVEEARKMMIEGTVEVKGTVQVDSSSSINNYISLAEDALDREDLSQVHDYTKRILDIDSRCTKAWIIKFKAYDKSGKYDDLISTGKSALRFSSDTEKKTVERLIYTTYAQNANMISKKAIRSLIVTQASKDRATEAKRGLKRAAGNLELMQIWSKALVEIEKTNLKSASSSLEWEQNAYKMAYEIPVSVLVEYDDIRTSVEEWITGRYKVLDAYNAKYDYYSTLLSDEPFLSYKQTDIISEWDAQKHAIMSRLNEAKNVIEEIRQQRISEYWKEHSAEKEQLDNEIAALKEKTKSITETVYGTNEYKNLTRIRSEIKNAEDELDSLTLFRMKEKRALREKLTDLNNLFSTAKAEFKERIAPYEQELNTYATRIREIDNKLNLK